MVGGLARVVVSADLVFAGVVLALYLLARESVHRWGRKPRERRQ